MGGGNNNTVLIRDSLGFLVVCNYYKKTICGNYINNIFYYFLISIMLKTNISKNIFWLYFWVFQLVILKYLYFNSYLSIVVLVIFLTNLAVACMLISGSLKKINKLYYGKWKNVAEHIVKKEMGSQKNQEEHWKKLSKIAPKLKLIRNVIAVYGFIFILFNGYLLFYHYLNYLIKVGLKISDYSLFYPNTLYIFFGATIL